MQCLGRLGGCGPPDRAALSEPRVLERLGGVVGTASGTAEDLVEAQPDASS